MKKFYVYILCNKRNGALYTVYTGITSDLIKRIHEHKNNLVEGFTRKYNIYRLVRYEIHMKQQTCLSADRDCHQQRKTNKGMGTAVETETYRGE